MSASSARIGPSSVPSCAGSCWPSPSTRTARWKPFSNAYLKPVWTAPPIPRLNGRRTTWAPSSAAAAAVPSVEPSSTTTTSKSGSKARISSITAGTLSSSLNAGTIAIRLTASGRGAGTRVSVATSATNGLRHAEPEQVEQAPCPVQESVLVERPLAGGAAHLLRLPPIVEQPGVGVGRLVGVLDDEQLGARLEPALDARVRIRDDRRPGHRQLERPRGGRGVDGGVGAARDVQVDARGRDRPREHVEGNVAGEAGAADVAAEVLSAQREVGVQAAARLADHRLGPLLPELVAVAVEEDVRLLLDRVRLEELGVGAPEHRLGAPGAELAEPVEAALGVGDDQLVLRRVGAEVVVEPGVVPAELGQAHRHVAVVEDDRHAEALPQQRRDPADV